MATAQRAVDSANVAEVTVIFDGVLDPDKLRNCYIMDNHANWPVGVCYARNLGIDACDQELILPLDADDYFIPGAIERMVAAWSPGKVVYGNWLDSHPDEELGELLEFKQAAPPEMLSRKHICHATYLFHADDYYKAGGYDPDFNIGAEDWAFMIALVNAGCELVRLDGDPLYVKTLNEEGRTHKAIAHKEMIKQLLLEKYPDFFRTR